MTRFLTRLPASGAEKCEPDHAQDQDGETGRYRQERKYGRAGFGLARFRRGFDDLAMSTCRHDNLIAQVPVLPANASEHRLSGEPTRDRE